MKSKLSLIFLFAFLIRLISLNQSLWLDEATSANTAKNNSYLSIITQFSPVDFHPPLYYFILKFWTSIFGYSEVSLRFPSILASLATGYFVYLIGKKLKNQNIGLWAAAFFLFNPLIIYYSQEARMYSLVCLFLTASLYFFICLIHQSSIINHKSVFLFNILSFISLSTHYSSIFFLSTLFLYLIIKKKYRQLFSFLPGTILAIVLLLPLVLKQFIYSRVALETVTNWSLVLGKSNLKNLFLIFLKFVTGRISFYPKIAYYALGLLSSLTVYFTAFKSSSRFLKYLFIFPLFIAFLVSFKSPMLQYFRYLYLIPILALLLAFSKYNILKILVLSNFLLFGLSYLSLSQFHREDWKSLAKSLPKNATVYLIPSFADPVKYYRPDVVVKDIKSIDSLSPILIPYGVEIFGLDYRLSLQKNNYRLISQNSFRQLTVEHWQKSP